jgi:hypothetical protein
MRTLVSSAIVAIVCAGCALAQARPLRFQGEVTRGAGFRKEIGRGLVFVLRPTEEGWSIVVEPVAGLDGTGCGDNYASVIAVPMRGYREVDLTATYGNTAKEAVALTPRDVDFVLSAEDCKREEDRRTKLTWPSQYTQKAVEEAQANFATSTAGRAVLKVLDSKVSPSGVLVEGKDYGKIDWLKFEVVVTFPAKP